MNKHSIVNPKKFIEYLQQVGRLKNVNAPEIVIIIFLESLMELCKQKYALTKIEGFDAGDLYQLNECPDRIGIFYCRGIGAPVAAINFEETIKISPNGHVMHWLTAVASDQLYISVLTVGELRKGIEKLPDSLKKNQLLLWLEQEIPKWFGERILSIDTSVAERWGYLMASHQSSLPVIDGLLAATALAHNLKMVTRNVKDFKINGLEIINPFV